MAFPKDWPDFADDQRQRFRELRLCPEQVVALRRVLGRLQAGLRKPAARNDVREQLTEVATRARELADKLAALSNTPSAAHEEARRLIEAGYWRKRRIDDGATVAGHLVPRLDALEQAAREARDALPRAPSRHKTGDPAPIAAIDRALRDGWRTANGSQRYPDALRASVSEGRGFHEIVEICYGAAGCESFPRRALEAYVKAENAQLRGLVAAFAKGAGIEIEPRRTGARASKRTRG